MRGGDCLLQLAEEAVPLLSIPCTLSVYMVEFLYAEPTRRRNVACRWSRWTRDTPVKPARSVIFNTAPIVGLNRCSNVESVATPSMLISMPVTIFERSTSRLLPASVHPSLVGRRQPASRSTLEQGRNKPPASRWRLLTELSLSLKCSTIFLLLSIPNKWKLCKQLRILHACTATFSPTTA